VYNEELTPRVPFPDGFFKSRIALALLLPLFSGCASTPHVKRLASAGAAYGSALDTLLRATQETAVDADSARLLSEGRGVSRERRRELLEKHAGIARTVAELERLRQHARLLGRYFEALKELSDSETEGRAREALEGAAAASARLGRELGASTALEPREKDSLGQVASFTVRGIRERAIADELKERGPLIEEQLRIQHAVLEAVRRKFRADRESLYDLELQREVIRPFVEERIADETAWSQARRGFILREAGVEALEEAGEAASRFRTAWAAFIAGRLDEAVLRSLLRDIESLVAFAETAAGRR